MDRSLKRISPYKAAIGGFVAAVAVAGIAPWNAWGRPVPVESGGTGSVSDDPIMVSETMLRALLNDQHPDHSYRTAAAILAITLLIFLSLALITVRRWKTSFGDREWTLVPNGLATAATHGMSTVASELRRGSGELEMLTTAISGTREEFSILRGELEAQRAEIERLRGGVALEYQRPLLGVLVRSLEIIGSDSAAAIDPNKTLRGVEVEISDALDDHGIELWAPDVGAVAAGAGLDLARAKHIPTSDQRLIGTIAMVHRRGFVHRTSQDRRTVLLAPQLSIYVSE